MSPASTSFPTAPADRDQTAGGSHSVRLRLKPTAPVSGYVDGGWWPRSRDLSAELPAVFAELGDRVGPVARVSYHLDGWDAAPRRLPARAARLEGFRTTDPHTLTVVGRQGARLVLLVVPSSTPDATAEAALDAASSAGDAHSPADLLAGTGS
jgi:Family of unknown function (DUF5994)